MVQVDVFWSYAIGAGFAAAASRQLTAAKGEGSGASPSRSLLENGHFTAAVIYLAVFFAPSGIGLLWAFPSWETMHVGDRCLSSWLVLLFAVTNITQGILGFWVTKKLYEAGRDFLASLQMPLGYFAMFFILVHGWDGTGYRRFFSPNKEAFLDWKLSNVAHWLVSDVALTLYAMGLVLLPVMFALMSRWIVQGRQTVAAGEDHGQWRVTTMIARVILGGSLGLAILASLCLRWLGGLFGALVFAGLAYVLALRQGAPLRRWLAQMLLRETL